jgi:phage shock protein B
MPLSAAWFPIIMVFMTVVLPLVIIMHYTTKFKATKGLSNDEQRLLEDLYKDAQNMQSRVNALETILDGQDSEWRKKT